MSAIKYGFINARVGAMKSHLLDNLEMKSLIESRNLDDALALLKNTAYGKELSKMSSPSLVEIENMFSNSMLKDTEKLKSSVSGISKDFLALYAKKFEIEALKLLLTMKCQGEDTKEYPWIMQRIMAIPMGEKLVEMETPGEIVEMLRHTKYYPALQKALSDYSETGNVSSFITALDTYFYSSLKKLLKNMSGKDKKIAQHMIGIEIDAMNLLISLRMRGTSEGEDLSERLIPIRYRLPDTELMAAFNAKTLAEVQQILKHYTNIVSSGVKEYEETQSLFGLENEFKRYILKENAKLFGGDRFHIGIPLAYLNLKDNEVRNLTAILHGKEEGMDPSQIEATVIMPA
jgi:ATP synthase A1 C subunit